jgi:hypothetical protein
MLYCADFAAGASCGIRRNLMSKLLYACLKSRTDMAVARLVRRVSVGASRIAPERVSVKPPRIVSNGGIVAAIANPSGAGSIESDCVCLGYSAAGSSWSEVSETAPEGTYAICRANSRKLQLVSDAVGTRTLWFYHDHTIFIASTSQRWIAVVLGSFNFNAKASPWMLTTGTLGPIEAWDRRISRLQADTILTLDREQWELSSETRPAIFCVRGGSLQEQKETFAAELRDAFEHLDFDYSKWVLPLSGGYDSRAILCMLRHRDGLRTITWGTRESLADATSDAAIALRVAERIGVSHEYFETDLAAGGLQQVFDQFIANGEGRIDRIGGYLDGFAIWRTLLNQKIEGIIRGDEGFGWRAVSTHTEARQSVGLLLAEDFANLPDLHPAAVEALRVPEFLELRSGETASQWRDRLYHQYRIPTILAALTDLKTSYVEIANPLLTHSIVRSVRALPDELRTGKRLFREVVDQVSPKVPYADVAAIEDQKVVLRSREAVAILSGMLNSEGARRLFSSSLLAEIQLGMQQTPSVASSRRPKAFERQIRRLLPNRLKTKLKGAGRKTHIDFHTTAFRIYVACQSRQLLEADAEVGRLCETGS